MFRRSVPLVTAAIFFAIAGPASAGVMTLEEECESCETTERLAFYGDAGNNKLSVETDGDEVVVTDTAEALEAQGPACEQETPNRVRCATIGTKKRSYGIQYFYAFLDEGDDEADFSGYTTEGGALVEGYGGDDTIGGTDNGDDILGGSGRDQIDARAGDDDIEADGWFFEENEEPNAKSVRDVVDGGDGDDKIDGDNRYGAHRVNGGKGADTLRGGSGNDRLLAPYEPKLLAGGPGDDVLKIAGGKVSLSAKVKCGAGADQIEVFASDRTARDCEQAAVGNLLFTTTPSSFDASSGKLSFHVACKRKRGCRGTFRLLDGDETVAKKNYDVDGDETLKLKLDGADAKRVAGKGLVLAFRTDAGGPGFKMRVSAPGA